MCGAEAKPDKSKNKTTSKVQSFVRRQWAMLVEPEKRAFLPLTGLSSGEKRFFFCFGFSFRFSYKLCDELR